MRAWILIWVAAALLAIGCELPNDDSVFIPNKTFRVTLFRPDGERHCTYTIEDDYKPRVYYGRGGGEVSGHAIEAPIGWFIQVDEVQQ